MLNITIVKELKPEKHSASLLTILLFSSVLAFSSNADLAAKKVTISPDSLSPSQEQINTDTSGITSNAADIAANANAIEIVLPPLSEVAKALLNW